jgi:hypothetical protein
MNTLAYSEETLIWEGQRLAYLEETWKTNTYLEETWKGQTL